MTKSVDADLAAISKWDPQFTARIVGVLHPAMKRYFRFQVRGLERIPEGAALVVSNHSGGTLSPDVPILAAGFYTKFGYQRPLFTLSHDTLMIGAASDFLQRVGFIPANHDVVAEALRIGGLVVVFPGGTYDVTRPTQSGNVIDFNGHTGYVTAALKANVPIVPIVSIGGQETQLFLSRGRGLARALRLNKIMRSAGLPISFGLPFGLSVLLPLNLPLPAKIVTQVLEPVYAADTFGPDPAPGEVDAHIRSRMQDALSQLATERRFPLVG